jgi:hypothetical protein
LAGVDWQGVIDAAVNGGVDKYKEAFFTSEYESIASPKEIEVIPALKAALLQQVELLEKCLKVHDRLKPGFAGNVNSDVAKKI